MFFCVEFASVFVSAEVIAQFMAKKAERSQSQVSIALNSPELIIYSEKYENDETLYYWTFRKVDLVDQYAVDNYC